MRTRQARGSSSLLRDVIRSCRKRRATIKLSDSTGAELTGGRALTSALALRASLHGAFDDRDKRVAVLLPPSTAATVTYFALALDGRVAVSLNYTLSAEILNGCLKRAGIRHVITSRKFLEHVPISLMTEFIYLEDIRAHISTRDKLIAAVMARVVPGGLLLRALGRRNVSMDDPLMIVFTSGTTGEPKGAVLTYGNASASISSVAEAIRLHDRDVIVGVMPFFHAFGSILTLWAALCLDIGAAYQANPLDARGVGQLCRSRKGTILLVTPTFLRSYQRRGVESDFSALEVIVTGGEPLTRDLADGVESAIGIRPVEGYGATETASIISAIIPPNRIASGGQSRACPEGSVGRPLPGVRAKVVDADTGLELDPGRQGLLWIHGPNVMAGYVDRPEATAEVLRDGWYSTGDIAIIDCEGCIEIVGRRSRFAKVGGEMVPLGKVEDALISRFRFDDVDNGPQLAVMAVRDEIRGERLVVIHRRMERSASELRRDLIASGMPPFFVPAAMDFVEVEHLPLTATGKLDFGRLNEIAVLEMSSRRTKAT